MGLLGSCVFPRSHTHSGANCPETGRLGGVRRAVRYDGELPSALWGFLPSGHGCPLGNYELLATLRAEKEEAPPGAEARGCVGTCDDTGWVMPGARVLAPSELGALLNSVPPAPFWKNGTPYQYLPMGLQRKLAEN